MKLYRFDQEVGYTIDKFDSVNAAFARIVRTQEAVSIGCIRLGAQSVLGYHPAVVDQLFIVVDGAGWVRGQDDAKRVPIRAGQAAFWVAGEGHESGSEEGMVVMVVEGERLEPDKFMPLLDVE
jgi:mannose-6-phosphate isomerase-like protein (cupin superfamily)